MAFGTSSFGTSRGAFGGTGSEEAAPISLNLTALMDILSNLLFFLLASYAVSNTEIKGAEAMQLPVSTSEQGATMSILVRVTLESIEVEGKPVARLKAGRPVAAIEGDKIVPLFQELERVARKGKKGVAMTEENTVLLVLADRRADFGLVSQVLKTAATAGFPNFRFAVIKR